MTYDLYFKYGIVNAKAGTSLLTVADSRYNGKEAYKMQLIANSSGLVKSFFTMSDTLTSYTSKTLVPLAYMKDAHEDGDHTIERGVYTYSEGSVTVRNINKRNGRQRYDTTFVSKNCTYDMLSIIYHARTLNYSGLKKNDKIRVGFFTGRRHMSLDVEYGGIEKVSANDGRKYDCIKLVLVTSSEIFEEKDEAMKVFITNDFNRIPIRIESKLKVGSTRAILKSYKGQRY